MPRFGMPVEALRAKVIDLGLNRMRTQGFDKVRLVDIAKDMGVSHAALYAHFTNRESLLDAVMERWLTETESALEAVCQGKRPALRKIEDWFLTLYKLKRTRIQTDPEPYRAFDVATTLRKPFAAAYVKRLKAQLAGLVDEAGDLLGTYSAAETAELLFEATSTFHHPSLVKHSAIHNRERLLRRLIKTLFDGLQVRDGE